MFLNYAPTFNLLFIYLFFFLEGTITQDKEFIGFHANSLEYP